MGLMANYPYPNRLECLTICRHHSKGCTLLSYSKIPSVGPVWGLNPQPPTPQSGALQPQLKIINNNHQNTG